MHRLVWLALLAPLACTDRTPAGETESTSSSGGATSDTTAVPDPTTTSAADTGPTPTTAAGCEPYTITIDTPQVTPSVVLLLDQSPAMLDLWDHDGDPGTPERTRWSSLRAALLAGLPSRGPLRLGLVPYPTADAEDVDGPGACALTPALLPAPDDAPPFEQLTDLPPADLPPGAFVGGAPLQRAILAALPLVGDLPEIPRALLVFTAGAANCSPAADSPAALLEGYDADVLELAAEAVDAGVRTHVFGLGAATEPSPPLVDHRPDDVIVRDTLQDLADAGQGDFVDAHSEAELIDALAATFESDAILSCTIALDPPPAPEQHVADVRIGDMNVPHIDFCQSEDGWVFAGEDAIELCGQACASFSDTGHAEIDVACL